MIIWSGLGFLAVLIPVVFFAIAEALTKAAAGAPYAATHRWPEALAVLLSAGLVWVLGERINGGGRQLLDPQTGQTVRIRRRHSLFFIPMQYVGIVIAVAALVMLAAPVNP